MTRCGQGLVRRRANRSLVVAVLAITVLAVGCGEEGRSSWSTIVLVGLAAVAAAAVAIAHQRGRRQERDGFRDAVLLDVDWLIYISDEPRRPGGDGVRADEVRTRAARLQRVLDVLADDVDRETGTSALKLREAVHSLADLTVQRLTPRADATVIDDAAVADARQRVRFARLRLVEAIR
jgi:hypothetical protein